MNKTNDQATTSAIKRREFGAFLRSRREKLRPEDVGLPRGFRRRTPGLRREEVAFLTGVGTTWYTWLEQGRDVQASPEVLAALAKALRLDAAERKHVFVLNERAAGGSPTAESEYVGAPLRRILQSLTTQPAYVLGRRWDILAWNRGATAVFGDYATLTGDARNIMHFLFLNPAHRELLVDWERLAPIALAMFRADYARYVGNPDFERLIQHLCAQSREFRRWWSDHRVLPPISNKKQIKHPIAGLMTFEYSTLIAAEQPELKLIVYTPDDARTASKLKGHLKKSLIDRRSTTESLKRVR